MVRRCFYSDQIRGIHGQMYPLSLALAAQLPFFYKQTSVLPFVIRALLEAPKMQFHRLNKTVLGVAIVAFGWMSLWTQSSGAPNSTGGSLNEPLQVFSSMLATGSQQLVVIDSANHSMAIYHVDPNQGKLVLKSVRNLTWDLSMEQFNGQAPLPSDLRQAR